MKISVTNNRQNCSLIICARWKNRMSLLNHPSCLLQNYKTSINYTISVVLSDLTVIPVLLPATYNVSTIQLYTRYTVVYNIRKCIQRTLMCIQLTQMYTTYANVYNVRKCTQRMQMYTTCSDLYNVYIPRTRLIVTVLLLCLLCISDTYLSSLWYTVQCTHTTSSWASCFYSMIQS